MTLFKGVVLVLKPYCMCSILTDHTGVGHSPQYYVLLLLVINHQGLNKIKIVVRVSSQKGRI